MAEDAPRQYARTAAGLDPDELRDELWTQIEDMDEDQLYTLLRYAEKM